MPGFCKNIEVDIDFIRATGVKANSDFTTTSPLQYDYKKRLKQASGKQYIVFIVLRYSHRNCNKQQYR